MATQGGQVNTHAKWWLGRIEKTECLRQGFETDMVVWDEATDFERVELHEWSITPRKVARLFHVPEYMITGVHRLARPRRRISLRVRHRP